MMIDGLTRSDHPYLDESDECAFVGEYTAGAGYGHSQTNQLIINLKKPMERRGSAEWRYKEKAVCQVGRMFRAVLSDRALASHTFVPIPPSKSKDDPAYDDRMSKVIRAIRPDEPVDTRELIVQTESTKSVHTSNKRLRPDEIAVRYRINQDLTSPTPATIVVVDDVLTTGAHFKAAQTVLQKQFPCVPVLGLFVARRVLAGVDRTEDSDL